jgi:hypothetical protein
MNICPNHNGPLCLTCRLGGLIRCPISGTPLPLVENEKPRVIRNKAFTARVWPADGGPTSLSESEALKIWKFINDSRRD